MDRLSNSRYLPIFSDLRHADLVRLVNPFAKRDSHSRNSVITYKILTIVTWLLSVIVSVYYTFNYDYDKKHPHHRLWDVNYRFPTGFTLNYLIASLYW